MALPSAHYQVVVSLWPRPSCSQICLSKTLLLCMHVAHTRVCTDRYLWETKDMEIMSDGVGGFKLESNQAVYMNPPISQLRWTVTITYKTTKSMI